jgi:preprotein translocase subunit SecD
VLGLDLQGGSYLLLEVDSNYVKKEKLDQVRERSPSRGCARQDRLYRPVRARRMPSKSASRRPTCRRRFPSCVNCRSRSAVCSAPQGSAASKFRMPAAADPSHGAASRHYRTHRQTIEQSIQIVERRINSSARSSPLIQRQGTDRILVQVPGLQDPTELKRILGQTAKMEFRMVDTSVSPDQAQQGKRAGRFGNPDERGVAEGCLTSSRSRCWFPAATSPMRSRASTSAPMSRSSTSSSTVRARENSRRPTSENVGVPFAIILDNKVISAPVIREPITGGQGQISGSFTVQAANELALPAAGRRAAGAADRDRGAHRSVRASARTRSRKGELAAYVGSIMVIVFMLVTYRLFGVFANIAVAINVAMIFGILSLLNATLTLPGIAGIVLTVGIAVDSNVLIYERIREELRGGRNAISAIDAGFRRALSTILDSNITTFIAAAVLFYIGTGPVRGFAVTLGIGIITTVFTAFTLTSLIVAGWVRWKRPKTVPI